MLIKLTQLFKEELSVIIALRNLKYPVSRFLRNKSFLRVYTSINLPRDICFWQFVDI